LDETLFAALVAAFGGSMTAIQAPTNGLLARYSGSPLVAALISFFVGFLALSAIVTVLRPPLNLGALRVLPWYAFLGGLYGAYNVTAVSFAAPRIGVALTLTLTLAMQLLTAATLDHFGVLGLVKQPISPLKIAGIVLVFTGVFIFRKG
jgi:transporter family-2 protein